VITYVELGGLIVQKWYWCGQSKLANVDETGEEEIDYRSAASFVEPAVSGRNIGIKIRNLTKVCMRAYLHVLCFWSMLVRLTVLRQ